MNQKPSIASVIIYKCTSANQENFFNNFIMMLFYDVVAINLRTEVKCTFGKLEKVYCFEIK